MNVMKIYSPLFDEIVIPRQLLNNPTVKAPFVIDICTLTIRIGAPNLERRLEDLLCRFLETLVFSSNFQTRGKREQIAAKISIYFLFFG